MNNKNASFEKQTINKVIKRIVPFLFLLYIISYIDRANIGYAALDMNKSLGLTSEVFGIVSGIFFLGYFIFEVPSNILLQRFGARIWIARILITWGMISIATAFAQNAMQLYIIRFLLGVAEAGFYPGIILYLANWIREKENASTLAMFSSAVPVSFVIGAPLSTWVMDHIHWLHVPGWRWMFIVEGLPAVILGIVTYFYLTEHPKDANWLTSEEKNFILAELNTGDKEVPQKHDHKKALLDPKVWFLSFIHFIYLTGSLGVGYWMPQIIKGFSSYLTNTQIGLIATIPYIVATIVMNYWSRRSDRKEERSIHSAIPMLVGAIGLIGAGLTSNPFFSIFLITVSLSGMYSFKGPFWALPSLVLSQPLMAVGVAVINSVGNLGGFVGPYAMGYLKDLTGSTKTGLFFLSGLLILGFVFMLFSRYERNSESKDVTSITGTSL